MLNAAVAAMEERGTLHECGGTPTNAADEVGQRAVPLGTTVSAAEQLALTIRHVGISDSDGK